MKKLDLSIDDMSAFLKLTNSFEPTIPLLLSHLELVKTLFQDFIKKDILPQGIQKDLSLLPQGSLMRLIASPYFCEALMLLNDDSEDTKKFSKNLEFQVIQAIIAEIKIINPNYSTSINPKWTINGDVVLDQNISKNFPPLQTSCGILLNYQSYNHNTGQEGIGGYNYLTALKHKERIETAKKIIEATSASATSLVETFTTIIQLRQNKIRSNIVNSSTHTSIGLVRCDNFHKLHEDMPEIVDMLVHESIHQYLHLYEEQIEPFVDLPLLPPNLLTERLFPSPWSGNPLDLRSYTHAILVWYGLVHFWDQYQLSPEFSPAISRKQAQEKLAEAKFGFENSRSVLDNLGYAVKYLNPHYKDMVIRIQEELTPSKKAI